jgi:hypothetical protein
VIMHLRAGMPEVLQVAAHQRIDGREGIHAAMIGARSTFAQVWRVIGSRFEALA